MEIIQEKQITEELQGNCSPCLPATLGPALNTPTAEQALQITPTAKQAIQQSEQAT